MELTSQGWAHQGMLFLQELWRPGNAQRPGMQRNRAAAVEYHMRARRGAGLKQGNTYLH